MPQSFVPVLRPLNIVGAVNWIEGDKVGVRPEATRIGRAAPGSSGLPVRVTNTVFLGNCVHIETATAAGGRIVAEAPSLDGYREGDQAFVWWNPADELRF